LHDLQADTARHASLEDGVDGGGVGPRGDAGNAGGVVEALLKERDRCSAVESERENEDAGHHREKSGEEERK
jgi:hypothetical protein